MTLGKEVSLQFATGAVHSITLSLKPQVLPAGKWVLLSCMFPPRMVSYPLPLGVYNCPDMKYRGVPSTRRFFTDSFYTEEAEVEVRQLIFLLIITPFPAHFA